MKKERKIKNIRTYYLANEDFQVQEKLEMIAYRERINVSNIVVDAIREYIERHGDGNPVFTLDHFQDPNFLETPAFMRDSFAWTKYIANANPKIKEEIKSQIIMIDKILGKYL